MPSDRRARYCPWLASICWQPLLILARFCFRQARMTWSPSFICARQYRETSRAQASCPARVCCADALVAIRTRGMTKKILFMCSAFIFVNLNQGVL